MNEVPMTELVQSAYDRAKSDLQLGLLPISEIQDLCHVAHTYAFMDLWIYGFMDLWIYGFMDLWIYGFMDLYQGSKKADPKRHYNRPIDKLYKLFDNGTLSKEDAYASFAFCYLKVFEIEGLIKKKSFLAQFEYEKMKHA